MAKIKKDSRLIVPHGNSSVWRYMSIEKFLSLITSQELFFANTSRVTDQYDGQIPLSNQQRLLDDLIAKGKSKAEAESVVNKGLARNNMLRNLSLMNCWSINTHESYALWKIYLEGAKTGIAVKTSFSRLKKALKSAEGNDEVYIGQVQYNNSISKIWVDRFTIFTNKLKYYAFEHELRLFMFYYPKEEGGTGLRYNFGKGVPINLDILIDEIYISPFSPPWFQDVLKETISRINPSLSGKIQMSKIKDQ